MRGTLDSGWWYGKPLWWGQIISVCITLKQKPVGCNKPPQCQRALLLLRSKGWIWAMPYFKNQVVQIQNCCGDCSKWKTVNCCGWLASGRIWSESTIVSWRHWCCTHAAPPRKKKKEKEKSTLLKISLAINCLCIVVPAVRIAVWNTNLIRVTAIKWKELNECLKSALLQVLCLLFWRQTVSMLWVPSARSQKSVVLIFMEVINFFFFFPSSPSSCG